MKQQIEKRVKKLEVDTIDKVTEEDIINSKYKKLKVLVRENLEPYPDIREKVAREIKAEGERADGESTIGCRTAAEEYEELKVFVQKALEPYPEIREKVAREILEAGV
jgi:hypothetical protein